MILAALVATLTFAPVAAPVGTPVVAHATQLAPNTRYALVWHTGDAHWDAHDGKFFGIVAPDVSRTLGSATSDAAGALTLPFVVPEDFGYLHDVELQANGAVAATQGFTVIPRLTLAPTSGPLGTPIHVTLTGIGYRFYQTVWHLMYDGSQTGWLSAITTHGTARVTIPAAGGLGLHTLQAIEGPTAPYLNEQQSPNYQPLIPTVLVQRFRITSGPPRLPPEPAAQLPPRGVDPPRGGPGPTLTASDASGPVGSRFMLEGRGFAPRAPVAIGWETIVGDDISGRGWDPHERRLGTIPADASGAFHALVETPDDLGGAHRIVASDPGGTPQATTSYAVVPSVVGFRSFARPGEAITIHLKGGGWGETGNIYTVVIDDAYFGYACGFNSQGDIGITIYAPGQLGWHFIDLYPAIYNGAIRGPGAPPAGSDVNGSYFLLPMLNVADHPGEQLPAYHLALHVLNY